MTAVAVLLGVLVGMILGFILGHWGWRDVRDENRDLKRRLQDFNRLLRQGRLDSVTPETRRRLTLITSNVRNGAQRGK